ncbi:MAG: TatD family hydrolase [Firmicutes bacterium]|nr:TatD family hydrolase [Bacillota bacterium]
METADLVLVDTHAHLNDPKYDRDLEAVRARAREARVAAIICVGYDFASSRRAVQLAGTFPEIYAAVGFHPHDAAGVPERAWEGLRLLAQNGRVVALGEMGFDFYRNLSPRNVQEEVFRRQLQLAGELNLPVIIHDRAAHEETLAVLEEFPGLPGVVFHCFSGGPRFAEECLARGYYLGIAGPITFPKSEELTEAVRIAPLNRLLLETDCPYLAPQPWRGRRNEPSYLTAVAEAVSRVKGVSPAEVAAATTASACRLFRIAPS